MNMPSKLLPSSRKYFLESSESRLLIHLIGRIEECMIIQTIRQMNLLRMDLTIIKDRYFLSRFNMKEWVWVQFFFLRAYLKFEVISGDKIRVEKARCWISGVLEGYQEYLTDSKTNPFAGLPELTNADGAYCRDSCDSQAWSCSGLIELVHDLNKLD
jgi:hypothetical protein